MKLRSIGFLALVGLVAFTSAKYAAPSTPVRQVGPYIFAQTGFDSTNINGVGGIVKVYLAGDSERIGQAVFISAKNTVKTDTLIASYNAIAGVVVGGVRTSMLGSTSVADTGTLAATSGQRVLVLVDGRYWTLVDSGAGFSPGLAILASSKSNQRGRIMKKPASLDSLSRIFGRTIDSAISGKAVLTEIKVR